MPIPQLLTTYAGKFYATSFATYGSGRGFFPVIRIFERMNRTLPLMAGPFRPAGRKASGLSNERRYPNRARAAPGGHVAANVPR